MKTQNLTFKNVSLIAICSLISLNTFAKSASENKNYEINTLEHNGHGYGHENGNNGNGNGNNGNENGNNGNENGNNGNGNGNNGNGNGNNGNGNGNNGNVENTESGNTGNTDSGNTGNTESGNTGNTNSGNTGNTQPSTNKTSGSSTLNVIVGEFYSINLSNENATISLDNEDKFKNGSESTPITMTIFSSKKYAVNAQVSSENFNGVSENTTVKTNNIDLIVAKTNGNQAAVISTRTTKSLKHANPEQIVSSTSATKSDIYSLTYAIPAANTAAFLDQYGKTISTQITYTLLPL